MQYVNPPGLTPILVNASLQRDVPFFLHFDAEFAIAQDLVMATLTGRVPPHRFIGARYLQTEKENLSLPGPAGWKAYATEIALL